MYSGVYDSVRGDDMGKYQVMSDAIGVVRFCKLCERFGGVAVYFSKKRHDDIDEMNGYIRDFLGESDFYKLLSVNAGTVFYIPKIDTLLQVFKERNVIEEYNGYNVKQLAIKYGLSQNKVYSLIINGAKKSKDEDYLKKNQLNLFDSI